MDLNQYLFENMLTKRQFAAMVGCTPNYISMISHGRCYPGREIAKKIDELTYGLVKFNDIQHFKPRTRQVKKKYRKIIHDQIKTNDCEFLEYLKEKPKK